jgi:hypothetical protein
MRLPYLRERRHHELSLDAEAEAEAEALAVVGARRVQAGDSISIQ